MNSRIVQPAPSFQPPETCTEHAECLAGQASNEDLCRAAQAHYDKVSTAAHEWHSAIPKAIAAYFADPERARLERELIEAAKAELAVWEGLHTAGWTAASASARNKLRKATRALIDFESQHKTK